MNFDHDHDRYVNKQKSLARAYDVDSRDARLEQRGYSFSQRQQEASCFNCKLKGKCTEFRRKQSGGSAGAVSYGGSESFMCDRFVPVPAENRAVSDKQIKSLLKNGKRGLR